MPRGIYNHKGKPIPPSRLGISHSKEARQKISLAMREGQKGGKAYRLGKQHSEETKRKIRETRLLSPNKVFKDTGIELKIEAELVRRGINYQKQVPLCKIAIVDFYLPEYCIVIQCDGCFYHGCPKHHPRWYNWNKSKQRDSNQDRVLTFNGFNVYRFWEHEINESVVKCLSKINL